jgi:hypothetical protein
LARLLIWPGSPIRSLILAGRAIHYLGDATKTAMAKAAVTTPLSHQNPDAP